MKYLLLSWMAATVSNASGVVFTNDFLQLPLFPHHQQVSRRKLSSVRDGEDMDRSHYPRRRLYEGEDDGHALQVGALYQGYGTHYVDLWVGTPPQRQTLIVDTGSGVTAFPCSGCADCGEGKHIDKFFQEEKSKTFKKVTCNACQRGRCHSYGNDPKDECRIGMSYQEGSSWNAFEAIDTVYIAGPHNDALLEDGGQESDLDPSHAKHFAFDMDFGCQTHLTGLFKSQLADGIMGMDNAQTAFWAQAHRAEKLPNQVFGLCFSRQPTAARSGTESGAVTLGGYDTRLHKTPLVYTSNSKYSGGFFAVHVRKMYLREGNSGESAKSSRASAKLKQLNVDEGILNHGNVIVDSGTTDTYFTRRISPEFRRLYNEMTDRAYGHMGVNLSQKQLEGLPTIIIQIAGDVERNQQLFDDPEEVVGLAGSIDPDHPYDVILAIPPTHYMEWEAKKGYYVARFYDDEGGGSVLGANAMMGHDIVFDADNKQVSFAESDCNYSELMEDNGFEFLLEENQSKRKADVQDELVAQTQDENKTISVTADNVEDDDDDDDMYDVSYVNNKSTGQDSQAPIIRTMDGCSSWACRGVAISSLVAFLVAGILVAQGCRSSPRQRQHKIINTFEGDFDEDVFMTKFASPHNPEEDDEV